VRVLLTLIVLLMLPGCMSTLDVGNQELSPELVAAGLAPGESTRDHAYRLLGAPNTVSHINQATWELAGDPIPYSPPVQEIWSYFVATVGGMTPLSPGPVYRYRQLIRVFFDGQGRLAGWDVRLLEN